MLRSILPLLILLVVAMGQEGKDALGRILGLQVEYGTYQFQKEVTLIHAEGRGPLGTIYDITCLWRLGRPEITLVFPVERWGL